MILVLLLFVCRLVRSKGARRARHADHGSPLDHAMSSARYSSNMANVRCTAAILDSEVCINLHSVLHATDMAVSTQEGSRNLVSVAVENVCCQDEHARHSLVYSR